MSFSPSDFSVALRMVLIATVKNKHGAQLPSSKMCMRKSPAVLTNTSNSNVMIHFVPIYQLKHLSGAIF